MRSRPRYRARKRGGGGFGGGRRLRDGSCQNGGRTEISGSRTALPLSEIASVIALPVLKLTGKLLSRGVQRLLFPEQSQETQRIETRKESKPREIQPVEVVGNVPLPEEKSAGKERNSESSGGPERTEDTVHTGKDTEKQTVPPAG